MTSGTVTAEERPDGQRRCPVCRESTPNPRSPNHTYCSDRCRSAAWYARHGPRRPRSPTPTNAGSAVTGAVDAVTAVTNAADAMTNAVDGVNAMTTAVNATVGPETIDGVNTVQLCPHYRKPISLLTLVVTPTAAHVAVPELPALAHRARRDPT